MSNRLADQTSPYLVQHADNPVHWQPWGEAALAEARDRDAPIFLSVGYSTCHWCHVMAHESFEDDGVAAVLNEHFVCVKVDREELPDVDEQYMLATQLFTQRGGWPNSVWLTPDGRPWYAGTYFPKPQFVQLLQRLAETWSQQREQVDAQAAQFVEAIRQASTGGLGGRAPLDARLLEGAADRIMSIRDERYGGFGGRPKFPPHGMLRVLLTRHASNPDPARLAAVTQALDAMRLGGMYDHVGGGFHRYATDAKWFLPHFEKMLYDNAQLIVSYADAWRLTGDPAYRHVIEETFAWLEREMTDADGGFYSALDADSEGEEGRCYLWTRDQVIETLGEEDGSLFAEVYRITSDGTYYEEANPSHRPGTSIAHLAEPIDAIAMGRDTDADELREKLASMRARLLNVRNRRVQPHLDDKVLASWNGLMIEALAYAGRVLDEQRWTDAAARAADFVLNHMRMPDGRLTRAWRRGTTTGLGYLDDYAYTVRGLLELHETSGDDRWLDAAVGLARIMVDAFYDTADGAFFTTTVDHDELILRSKGAGGGGNTPSANGVAAEALLRMAKVTGDPAWARPAAGTLAAFSGAMAQNPHGTESLLVALPLLLEISDVTGAGAIAAAPPVTAEAFAEHPSVAPGGRLRIALRIAVDAGYHIYSHDPEDAKVIPTTIEVVGDGTNGPRLADLRWPDPEQVRDAVLDQTIGVYAGVVVVVATVEIPADQPTGYVEVQVRVGAQPCDDRACLQPRELALTVPVEVTDEPEEQAVHHSELFE